MIVFMLFNMLLSSLALARYSERQTAAISAAEPENSLSAFLDSHFPDERMERIYPNAKLTQ